MEEFKEQEDHKEEKPRKCKGCGKEIISKWDWCCSCTWLENM
jgi:hypothetical protein